MERVAFHPGVEGWDDLDRANRSLASSGSMPPSLRRNLTAKLTACLEAYFSQLLTRIEMRLGSQLIRSARAMITVATGLRHDQIGIPVTMAQNLFEPEAPPAWVLLNRAPTLQNTALVALHPTLVEGDAVRLPPHLCRWLNGDFDGDMVAVLTLATDAAQEEAGRLLSVEGQVAGDPEALDTFVPNHESLWGLAHLWLDAAGRGKLAKVLPELEPVNTVITRERLRKALRSVFTNKGAHAAVEKAAQLWELGFEEAERVGGTLDPFALVKIELPPKPTSKEPEVWRKYHEQCVQACETRNDYTEAGWGAQLLAAKSGARGAMSNLVLLAGARGVIGDRPEGPSIASSGLLSGLSFDEYRAVAADYLRRTAGLMSQWESLHSHPGFAGYRRFVPEGVHVIARAMRSEYPGIVFARAAVAGEIDPLTDRDTRLFVGLLPLE